jgi:hypothetical protein
LPAEILAGVGFQTVADEQHDGVLPESLVILVEA